MTLQYLEINNLRNIRSAELEFGSKFNFLYGINGSGKTSLLEAIYFLGLGRSFRTRLKDPVIHYDADCFTVFGKVQRPQFLLAMGVERSKRGENRIRVNGESVQSSAELARNMPLQLLNHQSYRLLNAGPKFRRQFIDWGMFHVEHSFLSLWRQAQIALKQRNAVLKKPNAKSLLFPWDNELLQASEKITALRQSYVEALSPKFCGLLQRFLPGIEVKINFWQGWKEGETLQAVLEQSLRRDMESGHTQYGPHRADLKIRTQGHPAYEILSQGQQKVLYYALQLAQAQLLAEQSNHSSCIFLVDDLSAELDPERRERVISELDQMNGQVFITAIEKESLASLPKDTNMFHVEHGEIQLSRLVLS